MGKSPFLTGPYATHCLRKGRPPPKVGQTALLWLLRTRIAGLKSGENSDSGCVGWPIDSMNAPRPIAVPGSAFGRHHKNTYVRETDTSACMRLNDVIYTKMASWEILHSSDPFLCSKPLPIHNLPCSAENCLFSEVRQEAANEHLRALALSQVSGISAG